MSEDERITGHIIVEARRIERMLRAAGADRTTGLHEATTVLADRLSRECAARIRFIASVRNSVAHGDTLRPPPNLAAFDEACRLVTRELAALPPPTDAPDPDEPDDPDAEFAAVYRRRLRLCGAVPLVNSVYFAALMLRALVRAAAPLALLAFFLIGAVALTAGALDGDRAKLLSGGAFFALYWVATMCFRREAARSGFVRPWYDAVIPVWSALYLIRAVGFFTDWRAFFSGAPLLALNAAAVWLLCGGCDRKTLIAAGICVGAAFLAGAVTLFVRRKSFF